MLKMKTLLPLALILAGCSTNPYVAKIDTQVNRGIAANEFSAMFSPWEGKEAFAKMYNSIAKANSDVKVSVYSWSDSEFDKALIAAATNGANVKVVLHGPLAKKPAIVKKANEMEALELKGSIAFKVAPRNMHEKFVIVDGETLVNSSANMSNGAKTSYSENFVFLSAPAFIIENFENEFAVLWNSSADIISGPKDVNQDRLPFEAQKHQTTGKDVVFYSSSMNFDYLDNAATSADFQKGRYIKLKTKAGAKPYTVRDAIINAVDAATKTVYCSFNHFNMKEIADALVRASERGVDVRLTVDNQEFVENWRPGIIEMTPVFVDGWKKIPGNEGKEPPVRVKFYSHYPNPALWLLNHHKFLLIDGGTPKAVLLTGSYNLSETAEHKQFDNMVSFVGKKYRSLHDAFQGEFDTLWDLERKAGKPNQELVSYFTTIKENSLPIHQLKAVSLSWGEIIALRDQIRQMEPTFLRGLNIKTSGCRGFNVKTKKLWGCPQ